MFGRRKARRRTRKTAPTIIEEKGGKDRARVSIPLEVIEPVIWPGLPVELFLLFLTQLPLADLYRCRRVSRSWYTLISQNEPRVRITLNGIEVWLDAKQKCVVSSENQQIGVTTWLSLVGDTFLSSSVEAGKGRPGIQRRFR